ncbi:hypothetical protein Bca101_059026 [Brassica carinata]
MHMSHLSSQPQPSISINTRPPPLHFLLFKTVSDHPRERGVRVAWRLEMDLPHAGLSCVAPRLECVAVSGLDWGKPNSPVMCVDPGVRLGEAQFSNGGVTYYSPRLVT